MLPVLCPLCVVAAAPNTTPQTHGIEEGWVIRKTPSMLFMVRESTLCFSFVEGVALTREANVTVVERKKMSPIL